MSDHERSQQADAKRIDAMIAGAQKAGTTSLGRYLDLHPAVRTHASLEFPHFVKPPAEAQSYEAEFHRAFAASDTDGSLVLAKSVGVMFVPGAAERLHAHNPDVRIIVMIREPVARAYSAYWFQRSVGLEDPKLSFEQALSLEVERLEADFDKNHHLAYVGRGCYAPQISALIDRFGRNKVMTIVLEQLNAEPDRVLADVATFLDIAVDGFTEESSERHNQGRRVRSRNFAVLTRSPVLRSAARRVPHSWAHQANRALQKLNASAAPIPPIDSSIATELARRYEQPNSELESLLDRDLQQWWGVR